MGTSDGAGHCTQIFSTAGDVADSSKPDSFFKRRSHSMPEFDDVDFAPLGPNQKISAPPRLASRGSAVCIATMLFFWCVFSVRIVPPAHVGISVVLGHVASGTVPSGFHIMNPLASVVTFNLKTQLLYSENIVPTKEGLNVELDVSLLYHISETRARDVFLQLGEEFESVLVLPELQSAVRGLTSEVSAKALYTAGRTEIHDKLLQELREKLSPRGIELEDVLLKGIKLPKQLTDAIELKAQAEQESARMEFVLTKEQQEAERKKLEASGVAAFQRIVSEGISEQLLQWKGIEATEKLASSTNSKVVVMGNSKSSLPVLLSAPSEPAVGAVTDVTASTTSADGSALGL